MMATVAMVPVAFVALIAVFLVLRRGERDEPEEFRGRDLAGARRFRDPWWKHGYQVVLPRVRSSCPSSRRGDPTDSSRTRPSHTRREDPLDRPVGTPQERGFSAHRAFPTQRRA
jgi:hypothetical protein